MDEYQEEECELTQTRMAVLCDKVNYVGLKPIMSFAYRKKERVVFASGIVVWFHARRTGALFGTKFKSEYRGRQLFTEAESLCLCCPHFNHA